MFGWIKQWGGLRQFKLRGTGKVSAVFGLHVIAYNLIRLGNLLNPKVGIFYVSFLPQFVPQGQPLITWTFALVGIHVALSLVWALLLSPVLTWVKETVSLPELGAARGLARWALTALVLALVLLTLWWPWSPSSASGSASSRASA